MSYLLFKHNKRVLDNQRKYGSSQDGVRSLWKLFPLFIIRFLATRYCEIFKLNGKYYVQPFQGVLFEVTKKRIK